MAEWLCRGLQIPVQRFDSASGLQRRVTGLGAEARLELAAGNAVPKRRHLVAPGRAHAPHLRALESCYDRSRPRKITLLALGDRLCYKAGPVALDHERGPDPR